MDNNEQQAAKASLEELKKDALKHYEYVSAVAHYWSSLVPKAIEAYQEWISVEEKPQKFKNVLCISNKGQYAIACVDASGEFDLCHCEAENGEEYYTHWQPLPPPPTN